MKQFLKCLFIGLCFSMVYSCKSEEVYIPKPRSFPRVEYPQKDYRDFEESYCDFGFKYPSYSSIKQDEYFFEERPSHPCWFDIVTPQFNATLHCSYYSINKGNTMDKLVNDAFKMAGKHNIKAEYYSERVIKQEGKVGGIVFEIEGDVATPIQFFLTDSTRHFFRASLYFNNKVHPDSMAPIYQFIKTDIDTLISTMHWNKKMALI